MKMSKQARRVLTCTQFWLSYPFVLAFFYWCQRREWRRIIPRVWLSPGEVLARDLELYLDEGRQKLEPRFIEDFAKARDEVTSIVKKQVVVTLLIFVFLLSNALSISLDINLAGFSLKYASGVAEGLLLISNLLGCYTLLLQGNGYLLDTTIKSAIELELPPELRTIYLVRYFPHEHFGGYDAFNLPHLIPNKLHRGAARFVRVFFLFLLGVTFIAFFLCNLFLLIYYLWLNPNFGAWSYLLLFYILLLGLTSFVYVVLTRCRFPYLDYTINQELELLQQADPQRWRVRLDEIYGRLNADRAEMERRGYLKPKN